MNSRHQKVNDSKIQDQERQDYPTSKILNKHMSAGMKCANCGKGVMYGHNVSHAKNRTKRLFLPNLHPARVMINGLMKRVKLCTKCLRKLKKESKPIVPTVSPIAA